MTNNGMERALGKVEGKLDAILARLDEQDKDRKEIAKRVTSIEKQMYVWQGSLIVISVLVALFGHKLAELFGVRIS